ncbi:hypothetical protein [Brevundimonas sp.]|uniref:hypothetical protein n=1 Tax=Brevundimonas sp. TaxID=1871086 RepID=UPI002D0EB565|nr:hypothetical protein [Brevundimonas sp.]HWQ86339.1 hypothetical protein [Brevundimonas sp.]
MNKAIIAAIAASICAAGCATQTRPKVSAPPEGYLRPQSEDASSRGRIDLLPLLDMVRHEKEQGATRARFIGGYTRFHVQSDLYQSQEATGAANAAVQPRRYRDEDRGMLQRWLIGRSLSRVVSIRVSLSQPNVSATTTLAAATHESNRSRGESWVTEIHGRRMLTPYFRVDATTTATIEANLNASSSIQGDVSGTFINVLARAAALLAPSSTLVTSLTEGRMTAASDFVDQSISTLFAQTLTEKTATEFGPEDWGAKLVTVTASLPHEHSVADDRVLDRIGDWTVSVEPAIVSIFSTTPLCSPASCAASVVELQAKTAFESLAPYTVLNFRLDGQQTLVQAIRADEAVARALDALSRVTDATSGNEDRKSAARTLCNVVAGKAESLGFNRFDSAATVWAVGHSDLVSDKGGAALMAVETCASAVLFPRLGLPIRNVLKNDPPPSVPTVPAAPAAQPTVVPSEPPAVAPPAVTAPPGNAG